MIDLGSGPPLVLIPGIQGRWEWMRPAIEALARRARVITFSLCGDPGSGPSVDPQLGFEQFVVQLDGMLDAAGLSSASLCGVSYGGLVAVHYAAVRPARVRSLVIVSAPGPGWQPGCRVRRYLRFPRLMAPAFLFGSPARLLPEIVAACDGWWSRASCAAAHAARVIAAPCSPTRMAERARLMAALPTAEDSARIEAPTLVVTGEPHLDRVVAVSSTRRFLDVIPGARGVTLERTGHIGLVTRPEPFATAVADFVIAHDAGLQAGDRAAGLQTGDHGASLQPGLAQARPEEHRA